MHKLTKSFLHLWVSLVSVLAFGFGWVFLAHAQKPAPLAVPEVEIATPTQPVLEPIPSLEDYLQNSDVPPALVFQNPVITFPRLRTRGS